MHEDSVLSLDTVLAAENAALRGPGETAPYSALCISGGGIRSATFALGAIQALAGQGVLAAFDYLSTVSGGGYIGSWLTSWKHREGGLDRIIPYLRRNAERVPPDHPDPIQHLREYNSYLSPKLGFFSADTWTLVAIVARNMMLNWLVFLPLLMAAMMAPRLILSLARLGETFPAFYNALPSASLNFVRIFIPSLSGLMFATAVFNIMRFLPGVGGKHRKEHSDFDFLKWVLLPLVLAALAFICNDSWFTGGDETRAGKDSVELIGYWQLVLGVTGSALAGWLAYLAVCGKPLKERLRLFAPVTAGVLLAGWSAGSASYYLANSAYPILTWPVYITLAAPLLLIAQLLAGCMFVGFTSFALKDEDREWLARAGAWILLFVVGWAGVCAVALLVPIWAMHLKVWGQSLLAAAGGVSGWISALTGSSEKSGKGKPTAGDAEQSSLLMRVAMVLAAPVFAVVTLLGLSILTDWLLKITHLGMTSDFETWALSPCPNCAWWDHEGILEGTHAEAVLVLGLGFLAFSWLMAHFININKFSLHAMYRNRLIRAYLGASNHRRNASEFTGFAENDNVYMRDLDPRMKPFHVVNVTLNLVAGQRLAWQQRKAESFTITPLHCGSFDLGYRPSTTYAGSDGITLGTAITISGAAASPNMGYHSSPVIGFIMTLFNARLGAWLGNPGTAGAKTWQDAGPKSAIASLVREAFGLTNNAGPYVYLSDGGHFENLALYEMVRRRCRYIVVLDGGCDEKFTYGDLGNALRKIRIDLKVGIDFDERYLASIQKHETRCSIARICYSDVDASLENGWLLYVKPMIRGNEPPDVSSYASDHPTFPHESTADQFFDESQTESYRALGMHTVNEICAGWDGTNGLPGLFAYLSDTAVKAAHA